MTEPSPVPTLEEISSNVKVLQTALGAFMLGLQRDDEKTRATASARAIGSFRKLLTQYQGLPLEAQSDTRELLEKLHGSLVTLGIPIGPLRLPPAG